MNSKGEIIYFYIDDYEFEKPKKLADSFEEFLSECLMGKRYLEFDDDEENDYYAYLKHLGWA